MAYKIGDQEKDFTFIGSFPTIESVYSVYPTGGATGMWFTHTGDGNKRYNWSEFYYRWIPEDFQFPDPQNPTPIIEYLKGDNGKSAYQLAVENGFSGSLTEWLASLGGKGVNGKSAYELAVAAGYSGTLEEWLESFVSPYALAALFLSAKDDDTAEGKITFEKGLDVKDRISSDNFVEGALGHRTTKEGDAELKSLKVREFIETPELRKNRISVNGNEFWFTDVCVVESIEQQLNPDHFIIHPRLLEGDLLSFHSSDILRGIFSYGDGFYTCLLQVVVVHEDLKSMEVVTLNGKQPRAAMVLARQTNAVDTDRQGSIYADGLNKYIRVINGYDPENPGELGNIANLKLQIGDLSGINHPAFGGNLTGYGLFATNVFLLGTIMQRSWDDSQYMRPSFWRGVYNPLTLYGPGETVSFVKPGYGESTWICKKPTQGNDPANTEFWDPYVSGGETGAPGADGMNSYTAVLYQRSADSPMPAKPSDSLLYNFVTKELTDPLGVLGAWSIGIPAVNGLPLWVITATVASRTNTDTIATGDWSPPSMQLKDGEDGKDGKSIEFIFKRANTIPTAPDSIQEDDNIPEGWSDDQLGVSAQYPFEWACKRTKTDGVWSAWAGPSLWGNFAEDGADGISVLSVVPQYAVNSSDSIAPTVFSNERPTRSAGQFLWVRDKITFSDNSVQYTPAWVVTGDPGTDGDNGTSSAPITLYKRSATAPAMPSGTFTYTFATGALSGGTFNGWSQAWPADDGNPCWVIYASASGTTATASIAASQFTDPPIEWVKSGINTAPVKLYQRKATAPAKPIDWILYTFSTKAISDPLSVMGAWSATIPTSNGLPLYVIIAMAASRTDTDTINPGDWSLPSIETKDGADGQTYFTWIRFSDNADGTDLYATPTAETEYIGIGANKTTATPSANKADYIWSPFRGGVGPKGDSYYIWIKYADDGSGTGLSDSPAGKTYIGIAHNKTTSTESTNPADYTWSKLQGEAGAQGRDGITIRVTEWSPGFEYHNDEALTTGMRYLDVVTVSSGATQTRHLCKVTHTSSLANKPSATESTEWQTFNSMAPIYTPMLISPHAVLDFIQGQKILLRDSEGVIKGLVSAEGDGATGWVFMAGSDDPDIAPFKVNQLGKVYMDSLLIRTAKTGARLQIDNDNLGLIMYDGNGIDKVSIIPVEVTAYDEEDIGETVTIECTPAISADSASVAIDFTETPTSKTDWIEPSATVTIAGPGLWTIFIPAISYSSSGTSVYGSYSIQVQLIKDGSTTYVVGARSGRGTASGTIAASQYAGMTAGTYQIKVRLILTEEYNTCSASASISSGAIFKATAILTRSEIGTDGFNFIKSPTDYILNSNGTFVSRKGKMRLEVSDTKIEARNLTTNKLVLAPLDADECVPVINTHGLICAGNVSSGGTISNKYGLNSSATPNDPVGTYVITHGFGSSAYSVNIVPFNSSAWLMWRVTARATTSFTVQFATTAGTATNTAFDFQMFAMR